MAKGIPEYPDDFIIIVNGRRLKYPMLRLLVLFAACIAFGAIVF